MTTQELAKFIDGRKYGNEITHEIADTAKSHGFVIVFGCSDDLMEFRGAINDELGCYEGDIAYLTENGVFVSQCDDDECPYAEQERAKCKTIEALWCDTNADCAWSYRTDIPHETFNIMEDGKVYCRGIVFCINDLKGGITHAKTSPLHSTF